MASFQVPGADGCISLIAGTDMSSYQYHLVELNGTANTVDLCTSTIGAMGIGVLMNKPSAAGEAARVFTLKGGVCKCYAASALATVGTPLSNDASGHFNAAADGDYAFGIQLTTAGAAGDIIEVLWGVTGVETVNVSLFTTGS